MKEAASIPQCEKYLPLVNILTGSSGEVDTMRRVGDIAEKVNHVVED